MDELAQMHQLSERTLLAPVGLGGDYATSSAASVKIQEKMTEVANQPDEELEAQVQPYVAMPTEFDGVDMSAPVEEEKLTEDMLILDKNFVKAAANVYELFEGEAFAGTAEEAVQYGMDTMGEFSFNFFGVPGVQTMSTESGFSGGGAIAQAALLMNSGSPEQAQSFIYMLQQYERLPNWTWAGAGRMFRGLMNDPSTLMGLAGGGAPIVLKKLGQDAAAEGVKRALYALARNPGKYGMAAGAVYGGGQEAAIMGVESEFRELSPEEIALRGGVSTGIGAVAGGALAKTAEKVLPPVADAIIGAGAAAKERMAGGGTQLNSGLDPDPLIAAAGDAVEELTTPPVDLASEKLISQRLPTAVNATEDPLQAPLVTNTEVTLNQPEKKLAANFEKVALYPNMPANIAELPPAEAAEVLKKHVVDNLLYLHDAVPEATRQRSKLWYDGANKISRDYAEQYGLPLESVAGAMAALSPQKDWYQNADLGRRVIEIVHHATKGDQVGMKMTDEMVAKMNEKFSADKPKDKVIMDAIMGKSYNELELPAEKAMWLRVYDETYNAGDGRAYPIVNPEGTFGDLVKTGKGENQKVAWGSLSEIGKAIISIESGGDLKIISDAMGEQNKVRNFYNNIYNPQSANGDVTIDTHAIAAGHLRPLAGDATEVHHNFGSSPDKKKRDSVWGGGVSNSSVTGVKGLYGIYADAYREAAEQRGILPREMQSITWEAVRGLYTDVFKRDKQAVADINDIWYRYKNGEISIEEARNGAVERAGGIDKPTWED